MKNEMACCPATPALRMEMADVFEGPGLTRRPAHEGTSPSYDQVNFSFLGPNRRGTFSKVFGWLGGEGVNVDSGVGCTLTGVRGVSYVVYVGQYLLSASPKTMARVKDGLRGKTRELGDGLRRPADGEAPAPTARFKLALYAEDRAGILGDVCSVIERNWGSITDQDCQTVAAGGGEAGGARGLFRLRMGVELPRDFADGAAEQIRDELCALGEAGGWAVSFNESLTVARMRRTLSGIAGYEAGIEPTHLTPTPDPEGDAS